MVYLTKSDRITKKRTIKKLLPILSLSLFFSIYSNLHHASQPLLQAFRETDVTTGDTPIYLFEMQPPLYYIGRLNRALTPFPPTIPIVYVL